MFWLSSVYPPSPSTTNVDMYLARTAFVLVGDDLTFKTVKKRPAT
jgi:hypothetical protein